MELRISKWLIKADSPTLIRYRFICFIDTEAIGSEGFGAEGITSDRLTSDRLSSGGVSLSTQGLMEIARKININ